MKTKIQNFQLWVSLVRGSLLGDWMQILLISVGVLGLGISKLKDTFIQLCQCTWRSFEPALHFPKPLLFSFLLLSTSQSKPFFPLLLSNKDRHHSVESHTSPVWRLSLPAIPSNFLTWWDQEEWYSPLVIVGNTTRCCSVRYWLF